MILNVCFSHFDPQFLVSMGYSLEALPPNYLDKPPTDLSAAKRNLDLLVTLMKGPHDEESHALWNRLEEFLEKTTDDVYVTLNRLLSSIEFVLSVSFEDLGKESLFI